jgi:hypothetical protein
MDKIESMKAELAESEAALTEAVSRRNWALARQVADRCTELHKKIGRAEAKRAWFAFARAA